MIAETKIKGPLGEIFVKLERISLMTKGKMGRPWVQFDFLLVRETGEVVWKAPSCSFRGGHLNPPCSRPAGYTCYLRHGEFGDNLTQRGVLQALEEALEEMRRTDDRDAVVEQIRGAREAMKRSAGECKSESLKSEIG